MSFFPPFYSWRAVFPAIIFMVDFFPLSILENGASVSSGSHGFRWEIYWHLNIFLLQVMYHFSVASFNIYIFYLSLAQIYFGLSFLGSLSFLNLYVCVCHQIWEVFSDFFFKYAVNPTLFSFSRALMKEMLVFFIVF